MNFTISDVIALIDIRIGFFMNLKKMVREIWRYPFRMTMKGRLKNHNFSIISSNCLGGVLCHDCNEEFRSPTINLTVKNFGKFTKNIKYYLSLELKSAGYNKRNIPLAVLDDVEIVGVHYSDFTSLKKAWERRRERVNFDNIFIMATDLELKPCEYEIFDTLPYPKVCFTSRKDTKYDWMCYLPAFEGKESVGDTLQYVNFYGQRMFEKYFDCIKWLNNN